MLHRNLRADPDIFLRAVRPFSDDLVVGAECMFTWYWLTDLCRDAGIPFILGHALYRKAIHGGKVNSKKNQEFSEGQVRKTGCRLTVMLHSSAIFQ